MKIKFFFSIVLFSSFVLLLFVNSVSAQCTPMRVTGMTPAAIVPAMNQLRAEIGGINNGAGGTFTSGYREVNWDITDGPGGPNASRIIPRDFYNDQISGISKGLIIDGGFDTSTAYASSGAGALRFGDIDASYSAEFKVFSEPRLLGLSTIPPHPQGADDPSFIELTFFIPGTNTPATVSGFGAVFTDVDSFENATVTLFGTDGLPIIINSGGLPPLMTVPPADKGLSFAGVKCSNTRIARVRIKVGRKLLVPGNTDLFPRDMVALDDFIYGEPQAVCSTNCYFKPADFAGDGVSDFVVFRDGGWWILDSNTSVAYFYHFGLPCDIPINGDFDGDRKADLAVYRKPGKWIVQLSGSTPPTTLYRDWGQPGDIPVTGDYNGDNITDMTVWRPGSQGTFYVLNSPSFLPPDNDTVGWGTTISSFPHYADFPFVAAADPCPPY